jgi:DNA-binding MarR family transcriptional regulator
MKSEELPASPRLTFLMRLLHQHYAQAVEETLRDAGLDDIRPGDVKVFPFVPPEGISIVNLSVLAGVRKQTMAESVGTLVRTGYLESRPDPLDARSKLIFLTSLGATVKPIATNAGDGVEAYWSELTSVEELESLRKSLRKLVERIREADSTSGEIRDKVFG